MIATIPHIDNKYVIFILQSVNYCLLFYGSFNFIYLIIHLFRNKINKEYILKIYS